MSFAAERVPLQRYSPLMAIFHWLIAVLVVLAYVTSEGGAVIRLDPPIIHVAFGLGVLSLTLPRLLVRLLGTVPPPLSTGPRLLKRFASVAHGLLYALLIAVPLTGWLTASRLGLQIAFFSVQLPWLIEPNAAEPGLIATVHQVGGNVLLVLAALHVFLALWHSFWLRDRTLQRMWPFS
jgi:superoxide oxidase